MNTLLDAAKAVVDAHDGLGLGISASEKMIERVNYNDSINALRKAVADAEGMVLVPREPTAEQIEAIAVANGGRLFDAHARVFYLAMLAAAEVKP
jgi:hypothetical protein